MRIKVELENYYKRRKFTQGFLLLHMEFHGEGRVGGGRQWKRGENAVISVRAARKTRAPGLIGCLLLSYSISNIGSLQV